MKPVTLIALGILAVLAIPLLKPAPAVAPLPTVTAPASTSLGEQFAQAAGEEFLGWVFGPHGGGDPTGVISIDIA